MAHHENRLSFDVAGTIALTKAHDPSDAPLEFYPFGEHVFQSENTLIGAITMKTAIALAAALLVMPPAAILLTTGGAHAEGCTANHELRRIVPEYRAVVLDSGDIKRVMFVDWKDERLSTWKPGHNITFCPDENKMINTTINSVATLLSEFATTCKTLVLSDEIDRALESAWKFASQPNGDPTLFVAEAKSKLGWYYEVCTDHAGGLFEKEDFKDFANVAASLTRIDLSVDDPANANLYKARADKYEKWEHALESKKSWPKRIWQSFFTPH